MLLGELIADSGTLPEHWTMDSLSTVQLLWLAYWRRKREQLNMRRLGEMLGVIWTADMYKKSDAGHVAKRVKEVFIPLAASIAGKSLYDALDKTLDTNPTPTTGTVQDPDRIDMSSISVDAYRKLFQESQQKPAIPNGGLLSPAHGPAPLRNDQGQDQGVQGSSVHTVQATPSNQPEFDLEAIAKTDPELARHLDETKAW